MPYFAILSSKSPMILGMSMNRFALLKNEDSSLHTALIKDSRDPTAELLNCPPCKN